MKNFQVIARPTGQCLLHTVKPVWIVHYPEPGYRAPFYQVYRPAPGVKQIKDRYPWTLNNVAISEHGFSTIEDAMKAAESETL